MRNLYACDTEIGRLYIAQSGNDRFHPVYKDQDLGSYFTPQQAAEDLAGGYTFPISGGIDTARLGIPADISEWDRP